ncbi:putative cytoplasmic protein [Salmonella enterica subsp. enterica]|uniref:Putative cytoplasmic protein n=1 Tax=Salmonella enterica I TaxID=59201 RepID=A0A379WAF8_SALET|nr:putative cytoplasmic protein [Salmonella enterica subsp. enterica]
MINTPPILSPSDWRQLTRRNDGKQTPMRGHPVFIAQHATATCCRGCLAKWHQIPQGEPLSEAQQQYIVSVIHYWLVIQMNQR